MTSRSASTPGASSRIIPSTSPRRARFLGAYGRERELSEAEQDALPLLARGAALRFLLTRLVDFLNVPPGALVKPKDPLEYVRKLRFHQSVAGIRDYGVDAGGMRGVRFDNRTSPFSPTAPARAIPAPAAGARS